MTELEQRLTDHLRRRAAAANPRYDLEGIELDTCLVSLVDVEERRSRRRTISVLAIAACLLVVVAIAAVVNAERQSVNTVPPLEAPGTTTSEAAGPTSLAKAEDVEIGGAGVLNGYRLNIDVIEEDGEVTGEFQVNNVVVRVECADTDTIDGETRLGGEVIADPSEVGLAVNDGSNVVPGDSVALIIRERGPDFDMVSLYANDREASCTELVESFPYNFDGGFFNDVDDGEAIETGGVLFKP